MAFRKLNGLFKSAYEPNNLLKTNVVASGLLLLIGDTIQQSIELYRGVHEKGKIRNGDYYNDDIPLDPNTLI